MLIADFQAVDDRKEEKVEEIVKEEKVKKEATGKRKADDSPEKAAEAKKAKGEKPKKGTLTMTFTRCWPRALAPKTYATIDDLKKAILANPGGKPKKEEKFKNWVKNTMKCSKDEWFADLWSWHNEQQTKA